MKKYAFATSGMLLVYLGLTAAGAPLRGPAPAHATLAVDDTLANAVIQTVCTRCHNDERMRGNMSLASFDADAPERNADLAERVIRKLRTGMMPPPGTRRPDESVLTGMAEELEGKLDAAALANPNPGTRTFQMLNRAEYTRAIRALLDLDVDASAFLPTETISDNFDNIADVQMMSATLMEGYLRAASQISRMAVGDPDAGPRQVTYKVPKTASQAVRAEGAPLGTRGGISVIHVFPADGEYVFKLDLHPGPTGFLYGMTSDDEKVEVSVNGERVALLDIDPFMSESDPQGMVIETEPIHVRAGPQRVTAAFLLKSEGPDNDLIQPIDYKLADSNIGSAYGVTTLPHLRDFIVTGPFVVTGVSETPSRRKIFTCRPTGPEEERPCAETILRGLAERAYRRPVSEEDLGDLMGFFDLGTEEGGFEVGVRTALQAILASPHFVFRLEEAPADVAAGESYRISDVDLASRLSFFLWGSPPDDELVRVAESGTLSETATLEAQVDRMLADPRAEAIGTRFGSQWLRLQDLEKLHPDAQLYPYYDATLATSMERETELFFYS
ncbi:MAG: DUF1592 domain-containing protein, partial [Gemmatimonadetes bacterium]|nr:DUF1592 domain-containing protein [Gemmatimonadota bacterium]